MNGPGGIPAQARDDGDGSEPASFARTASHDRHDPGREARWDAWRAENAEAIVSWNAYIDEHGLPLASFSRP